jgi:MFS family permease
MLVGRFIFGLGGECMTVAQSVIIANWFKGKEFSFAMGLSLSVSRLGSVLNGILLPRICAHQLNSEGEETIGLALFVGFFICLFSLLNACFLVSIDYYADKSEGVLNVPIPDDEKFHFSDICAFKLPYWLLTGSCVAVYMCVLNYLQVTPNIL